MSEQSVRRRIDLGLWRRVRRGVFAIGAAPATWHQRAMAAALAGGSGTLVGVLAALRLWDVIDRCGPIDLISTTGGRLRLPGVRAHQSILLPPIDQTERWSIPVTTLARSLVDGAQHQPAATVGAWIDHGMRVHGLDLLDLRSCIARLAGPGRRELTTIRAVLATRIKGYDPGDSNLETRALRALAAGGLPAPVQQHRVRRGDGRLAVLDLAYPAALVAIELDGFEWHGRTRTPFDHDRRRDIELTLLGWDVYRFTSTMPDSYLVDSVRAALAKRST